MGSTIGQQPLGELGAKRVGQVEDTLDVGLARAGTDYSSTRATSEQQVERVGEHRLAGARLAREHVQPGRQPQLRALDQQEVLDVQLLDHAGRCSSVWGRIARAGSFFYGAASGGMPACVVVLMR